MFYKVNNYLLPLIAACTAIMFVCRKNRFWTKWQTNKKQSRKRRKLPPSGLFFYVVKFISELKNVVNL